MCVYGLKLLSRLHSQNPRETVFHTMSVVVVVIVAALLFQTRNNKDTGGGRILKSREQYPPPFLFLINYQKTVKEIEPRRPRPLLPLPYCFS